MGQPHAQSALAAGKSRRPLEETGWAPVRIWTDSGKKNVVDPVCSITACALVNTIILKPDDGPVGSKHVVLLLVA